VIGGTYGNGGSAGAAQTINLDCSAYARCSRQDAACPAGTSCLDIPGCETPICAGELCDACPGMCSYLLIVPPTMVQCEGTEFVGVEPHTLPVPC
jgi:hypothetical protein